VSDATSLFLPSHMMILSPLMVTFSPFCTWLNCIQIHTYGMEGLKFDGSWRTKHALGSLMILLVFLMEIYRKVEWLVLSCLFRTEQDR
jgi:hypothetical protein